MKKYIAVLLVGIMLISGCSFTPPDKETEPGTTSTESTGATIEGNVLVSIGHAEGTIELAVENNDFFEDSKAEITGETITQTGNQIVHGKHNVADWGAGLDGAHFFDGSYNVAGPNLNDSRFRFIPTRKQDFNPLSCGVNYYDLILKVEGFTYTEASVLYGKEMCAYGAENTVSFLIFPISEAMKETFCADLITISCSVNAVSDVSLTLSGATLNITSTSTIEECMVMTEADGEGFIKNANTPACGYQISIENEPEIIPMYDNP